MLTGNWCSSSRMRTGELTWRAVVKAIENINGTTRSKIDPGDLLRELQRAGAVSITHESLSTAAWKRWAVFVAGKVTKVADTWRQAVRKGRGMQLAVLDERVMLSMSTMRSIAGAAVDGGCASCIHGQLACACSMHAQYECCFDCARRSLEKRWQKHGACGGGACSGIGSFIGS